MHQYNFGTSGDILLKLFQPKCCDTGVITCVQFLEGPFPKIWGAPQFAAFEFAADEIAARNWPPRKRPTILIAARLKSPPRIPPPDVSAARSFRRLVPVAAYT